MPNLFQVLIGYLVVLSPQLLGQLQEYQALHPSPYLSIVISLLGAVLLHRSQAPGK